MVVEIKARAAACGRTRLFSCFQTRTSQRVSGFGTMFVPHVAVFFLLVFSRERRQLLDLLDLCDVTLNWKIVWP